MLTARCTPINAHLSLFGRRMHEEALDIFDELEILSDCRPKSRLKAKKPLTKAQKMGKRSGKFTLIHRF